MLTAIAAARKASTTIAGCVRPPRRELPDEHQQAQYRRRVVADGHRRIVLSTMLQIGCASMIAAEAEGLQPRIERRHRARQGIAERTARRSRQPRCRRRPAQQAASQSADAAARGLRRPRARRRRSPRSRIAEWSRRRTQPTTRRWPGRWRRRRPPRRPRRPRRSRSPARPAPRPSSSKPGGDIEPGDRHIGQRFHADRQRQRRAYAGRHAPWRSPAFGADNAAITASDSTSCTLWWSILPGAKMPMKCSAAAPMMKHRQHCPIAADGPADPDQEEHRRRQKHQRPGDQRDGFAGRHAAGDRGDGKHDRGDRRIDKPRPVHDEAAVRAHAVLVEVEPALAADQVADLHQAEQAVIVAVPEASSVGKPPTAWNARRNSAPRAPAARRCRCAAPRDLPCANDAASMAKVCAPMIRPDANAGASTNRKAVASRLANDRRTPTATTGRS